MRSGAEYVVAAGVGPAHVVEQQQRKIDAGRPLADQAQLLAQGVVVVVAVDDHRAGQRELPERIVARLDDELQLGMLLSELDQLGLRIGVDRRDADISGGGPIEQLARQLTPVGADLQDELCPDRFETRKQDLPEVGERVPAIEVGHAGSGFHALAFHE